MKGKVKPIKGTQEPVIKSVEPITQQDIDNNPEIKKMLKEMEELKSRPYEAGYEVVEGEDKEQFQKDVLEKMSAGWLPVGGVQVCTINSTSWRYFQVVAK